MRRRGCRGAFSLILVGDGYESVPEELMIEAADRAGAMLLTTARFGLVEPFVIDRLWVVGCGIGRGMVLGQCSTDEVIRLRVLQTRPMSGVFSSHPAASSVLLVHPTSREMTL